MRIKVRQRGQLTVPKLLRQSYGIKENSFVTITPIGSSLVISRRPSVVDQLQQAAKKELIDKGVTLKQMLKDMEKTRKQYNARRYGLKDS